MRGSFARTVIGGWLAAMSLLISLTGVADATVDPRFNWSYGWASTVNADIYKIVPGYEDPQLVGHQYVSCSQGYVEVKVWAYPIRQGTTYWPHSESAYGNAWLKCTITFVPGYRYSPEPAGLYVRTYVSSSGTYELDDLGPNNDNPDFACWVHFEAHSQSVTDAKNSPALLGTDAESYKQGNVSLSATDTAFERRPKNVEFTAASISATAHASNGVAGHTTIYAHGTHSVSGWGIVPDYYPYY